MMSEGCPTLPDASLLCWKYSGELLPILLAYACNGEHRIRCYTSMYAKLLKFAAVVASALFVDAHTRRTRSRA